MYTVFKNKKNLLMPYNVFHQLRPVSPDGLDCLKHVDFAVLDDLLDASIGGAVYPGPRLPIPARTRIYMIRRDVWTTRGNPMNSKGHFDEEDLPEAFKDTHAETTTTGP